MNHFLITGGSGFIGSNLAARLETVGKIVLCDHPITEEKARNLEKRKPFQFIDQSELFNWLETSAPQFDHVFHLGASSSTTVTDVEYLTRNNTEPAKLIWRYCTKHQIGLTYASSAATYGDGSIGFDDDPNLLPRLRPLNPYAQSKHDFDCWAMDQAAKASAPPRWFAMKFFNVFGPNEFHKGWQSSVFPNLVRQIRETGEAELFASPRADIGNGEQLRDFIHVDDCIDHMLHLRANGAPSGIYNSATGEAHSFRFITETVFDVLGLSPVIRYIPMPDNVRKHYQYFTEGTMERYCRATGRPATAESFTDRIADYVRNYLEPTRRWR